MAEQQSDVEVLTIPKSEMEKHAKEHGIGSGSVGLKRGRMDFQRNGASRKDQLKKQSEQEKEDKVAGRQWATPRYQPEHLIEFFEGNVWHRRAIQVKAALAIGLGYTLQSVDGEDRDPDNQYQEIIDFLDAPSDDPIESINDILYRFAIDYLSIGDGYLEADLAPNGKIAGLYHVRSEIMRRAKDWDNMEYYQLDTQHKTNAKVTFDPWDPENRSSERNQIIHLKEYDPKSDYYGLPSWIAAAGAMILDRSGLEYNIQNFKNNFMGDVVITVSGAKLGDKEKDDIKQFIKDRYMGLENSGRPLILSAKSGEAEFHIEMLNNDPKSKDFSYLEGREQARDEIISMHGVPPRILSIIAEGSLGSGQENQGQLRVFKSTTIDPIQHTIEKLLNRTIINTFGEDNPWRLRFNEMDTTNLSEMAKAVKQLVGAPILDRNEGRQLVNYSPKSEDELEELQVQNTLKQIEDELNQMEKSSRY